MYLATVADLPEPVVPTTSTNSLQKQQGCGSVFILADPDPEGKINGSRSTALKETIKEKTLFCQPAHKYLFIHCQALTYAMLLKLYVFKYHHSNTTPELIIDKGLITYIQCCRAGAAAGHSASTF